MKQGGWRPHPGWGWASIPPTPGLCSTPPHAGVCEEGLFPTPPPPLPVSHGLLVWGTLTEWVLEAEPGQGQVTSPLPEGQRHLSGVSVACAHVAVRPHGQGHSSGSPNPPPFPLSREQADLGADSGGEEGASDLGPKDGEGADVGRGQEGGSGHRPKQSGIRVTANPALPGVARQTHRETTFFLPPY